MATAVGDKRHSTLRRQKSLNEKNGYPSLRYLTVLEVRSRNTCSEPARRIEIRNLINDIRVQNIMLIDTTHPTYVVITPENLHPPSAQNCWMGLAIWIPNYDSEQASRPDHLAGWCNSKNPMTAGNYLLLVGKMSDDSFIRTRGCCVASCELSTW
jgi:hypothetical protein